MDIRPLNGPFGVEASGLDLAARADDHEVMAALTAALYAHRLLVIRGQDLSPERFLRFGRQWGRPHPHVLDHLRMPGFPEILPIGNVLAQAADEEVRNGAAFWHTDQSYEAEPVTTTMLYSVKAPREGGETLLADMVAAYDALDGAMKARIGGLRAVHLYGAASGRGTEKIAAPLKTHEQAEQVPEVRHPIARTHPIAGHIALYAVAGTPIAIDGLDAEEGQALLSQLKAHALQERFICRHSHAVGDVAIWDTLSTLHSATPIGFATCEADSRLLYRISVKGLPKLYEERHESA